MSATTEVQDAKAVAEKRKRMDALVTLPIAIALTVAFSIWVAPEANIWGDLFFGAIVWGVLLTAVAKVRALNNQAYGPSKK